ncbi:MAG: pre-peptidase C-terminal domain-containing protein, partial [Fimbriimonadales bacterium]|nr:pre-peptidase C-terminal domain-containing protein [Fimbriimonadales bacterium]
MRKIVALCGGLSLICALAVAQLPQLDILTDTEANNTTATAQDIGVAGIDANNVRRVKIVHGLINPDGDVDFYRVQLLRSGTYSFRVDCTLDAVLAIHNSSGAVIAENDDDELNNTNRGNRDTSFTNADPGITISLSAGTYFVQVRSIATSGILARFRYTLRIFDGSTAPDYDPYEVNGTNETFGTATDIGNLADDFTLIRNGFLQYRQFDLDHYRIEIGEGNLTVRTFGATDTIITVYNSALNPLATNDDDPHDPFNPYTSLITLSDLPAGIYYIRVEGFGYQGGRAGGWYDVQISDYTPVRRFISGRVNFDRQNLSLVPFTMQIFQAGTQNLQSQRTFYTNNAGQFTTYTSVRSGTVDIAVRAPTSLRRILRGISLDSDVSGLVFNLINGDLNQDNVIDDADLLLVLFNFGSNNAQVDLNGDGVVDDADLLTVLFNFGRVGD